MIIIFFTTHYILKEILHFACVREQKIHIPKHKTFHFFGGGGDDSIMWLSKEP
jgi:hypothetical protein